MELVVSLAASLVVSLVLAEGSETLRTCLISLEEDLEDLGGLGPLDSRAKARTLR